MAETVRKITDPASSNDRPQLQADGEAILASYTKEVVRLCAAGQCLLCRDGLIPTHYPADPNIKGSVPISVHRMGIVVEQCPASGSWAVLAVMGVK